MTFDDDSVRNDKVINADRWKEDWHDYYYLFKKSS